MKTHLEFTSSAFPPYPSEDNEVNTGHYGKRLAELLVEALPRGGFAVAGCYAEDWGWRIDLQNEGFPLWIGCGNYEEFDDGFLCFIEPSKPFVRRWLTKIRTVETVERLASAVETILRKSGKADRLRWWPDEEDAV